MAPGHEFGRGPHGMVASAKPPGDGRPGRRRDGEEAAASPAQSIAGALRTIGVRHVAVLVVVLVYPWVASPFFVLSDRRPGAARPDRLVAHLLGGYGGMVSLAQMSIAGLAGYMVAIFGIAGEAQQGGASSLAGRGGIAVPIGAIAALFATFVGWLRCAPKASTRS
jgi:branched-chain amino acid transport system permease protein